MKYPRRLPSLRRFLIQMNIDLVALEAATESVYHHSQELSPFEQMAIILEDKRFLEHRGIDWWSVARILLQSCIGRRKGGASTIEMQFVRTVLDRREMSLRRKLGEMLRAWLLNFRMDKSTILRSYLSCAFFGSHLVGAETASSKMFDKSPAQLTLEEGAQLASMLVYPKPLTSNASWERRVLRRARYGLRIHAGLKKRLKQKHMT